MNEKELIRALIDKLVRFQEGMSTRTRIDILVDVADNCLRSIYSYAHNYPEGPERELAIDEYEGLAEWFDVYHKKKYSIRRVHDDLTNEDLRKNAAEDKEYIRSLEQQLQLKEGLNEL